MLVEIWSDVVCPWCYIGKRRFETALRGFEGAGDVEVQWRSFSSTPTSPRDPGSCLCSTWPTNTASLSSRPRRCTSGWRTWPPPRWVSPRRRPAGSWSPTSTSTRSKMTSAPPGNWASPGCPFSSSTASTGSRGRSWPRPSCRRCRPPAAAPPR
ncbi:MAG: DsbA family protein [Actinobacteria bacterium]|nr:DsbA family protein [Actinomycetota bacterium]